MARYRDAVVALRNDSKIWLSTHGDSFEAWCRHVVDLAAAAPRFAGAVHVSGEIGRDEFVDIAIVESSTTVAPRVDLFSIKAARAPEPLLKGATSKDDVLTWLNRRLFAESTRGAKRPSACDARHRSVEFGPGALRALDERIRVIRRGEVPWATPNALIAPVVVLPENIGDNGLLCRWIHDRCREEALFTDNLVLYPTLASVREFETLLALAAHGQSVFDILSWRSRHEGGFVRLGEVLADWVSDGTKRVVPGLEDEYNRIADRMRKRLRRLGVR